MYGVNFTGRDEKIENARHENFRRWAERILLRCALHLHRYEERLEDRILDSSFGEDNHPRLRSIVITKGGCDVMKL
jgi:hypothetical protein